MAAGAGLRPRPSPTTSISSSDSSASSDAGATFHFLAMRQRGMAAPASASARPHQRETDEQRKREKRERAAPRASGLTGDRARPLAVVGIWCEGRPLYRERGVARADALRSVKAEGCPHSVAQTLPAAPTWSDTSRSEHRTPHTINQWTRMHPVHTRRAATRRSR